MKKKTVLVAPLNWGLGHATRCIPVINELLCQHVDVIIASDGSALKLLRQIFPGLKSVELPGYNVKYQKRGSFAWAMLRQFPSLLKSIKKEHELTLQYTDRYRIDAIISDNRFGLWHPSVPSVIMSHQLYTHQPGIWTILAPLLHFINHSKLRKFNEIWIPDTDTPLNLSGTLSHRSRTNLNTHFIGWLSQFDTPPVSTESVVKYDLAVVLSGPEPQRTALETLLLPQINIPGKKVILVRGLPTEYQKLNYTGIKIVNYLTTKELHEVMSNSETIICRSGYTSLMDLAFLKKKAILIPTPGQIEQEYLAGLCEKSGYCPTASQHQIDLPELLHKLTLCSGFPVPVKSDTLQQRINALLNKTVQ